MAKTDSELKGRTVTDNDGQQYFIYGNTRIVIVEHFPSSGPTLEDTLFQLTERQIRDRHYISA